MIRSWNVDDGSIEAIEAQFRGLNRRLYDLEEALHASQEILREEPDNFAFKMSSYSLLKMHSALQAERVEISRFRENEPLVLVLNGGSVEGHSADAISLSVILNRFQRLFSSIAQAITTGPTMRGPLSGAIVSATNLKVANTFPSSFGVSLYVPSQVDLHGNSVPSAALNTLFELLGVAERDGDIMSSAGEIGSRSLRHLNALAKHLAETGTTLSVGWKDTSGIKRDWKASPDVSRNIVEKIRKISQTRSERYEISGKLVGASLLKDRFEIVSDESVFEGRFVTAINDDVKNLFGKNVRAEIEETEIRDLASNNARSYFTLTTIAED